MKLSLVSGSVYNASLCKNDCYYSMAEKKYWKISLGVMVIPRESIEFSHSGLRPSWVNSILSLGITITPRDIFQYFFSAIEYLLIMHVFWSVFCSILLCRYSSNEFTGTYPPMTTTKLKTLFLLGGLLESSDDVVVPMAKVVIIKHKWK